MQRTASSHTGQTADSTTLPFRALTGSRALIRIAAFGVLLAFVLTTLHVVISIGFRRIETGYYGSMNRILAGDVNADLIITGSSRALVHYDPAIISSYTGLSAYNIGMNAALIDMQLATLESYLRHNKTPKVVVHNLDLFSFKIAANITEVAQYTPYIDESSFFNAINRRHNNGRHLKYIPLYKYIVEDISFQWMKGLAGFFGWQPRETRHLGFEPRNIAWRTDFERFKRAYPNGMNEQVDAEGIDYLKRLIDVCKTRSIQLIFSYSPEYQEVHSYQNNRDEIFGLFHEIAESHGIPILDFSRSTIAADKELFYNSQHLNADGARLFSHTLGATLSEYISRR